MRIVILVLGGLVALVLLVIAIGFALPIAHVATRDARFAAPPERVFGVLRDVEKYPAWRSDVERVEVLATVPALRWRERGDNRIVTRIADRSLPFGGSWTYELSPQDGGTRLAITENGEVYNPLFRFMSRFVFGHTATLEQYLVDLEKHLR